MTAAEGADINNSTRDMSFRQRSPDEESGEGLLGPLRHTATIRR